jgi:hypothetical protein
MVGDYVDFMPEDAQHEALANRENNTKESFDSPGRAA